MTANRFNALSQTKQCRALLKKGIFMAEKATDTFSIIVFKLYGFYVEIFYPRDSDEIAWVKSFDEQDKPSQNWISNISHG
jgi:hypothetical protein